MLHVALLKNSKVQRIICQPTLYDIRERTNFVGKGGLLNHIRNNTLIRCITMPNVMESSKTEMLLEDIFFLDLLDFQ